MSAVDVHEAAVEVRDEVEARSSGEALEHTPDVRKDASQAAVMPLRPHQSPRTPRQPPAAAAIPQLRSARPDRAPQAVERRYQL